MAWSDAARKASAERRRANAKNKTGHANAAREAVRQYQASRTPSRPAEAYEDQPVPVTRYKGTNKPNPTLDELLTPTQKKRLKGAFADLRFPGTNSRFK